MTSDPQHDRLLAAVLATPADDQPRLIYADWLEEQPTSEPCGRCNNPAGGFPGLGCYDCAGAGRVPNTNAARAEFIRVQVELARLGCYPVTNAWQHFCRTDAQRSRGEEFPCYDLRRRAKELWGSGVSNQISLDFASILPSRIVVAGDSSLRSDLPVLSVHRGFVESITCSWDDCRTHLDAIRRVTPLRRVRLTDVPEYDRAGEFYRGGDLFWHSDRWPDVDFELPRQEAVAV